MDTLPLLQQPHFHLGSHVTQVLCCCFSPDGSSILSGFADNTLQVWSVVFHSLADFTLFDVPALIERDVRSFLVLPPGAILTDATTKVLTRLCESSDKGFYFRSSVLQLVVSKIDEFCVQIDAQRDKVVPKLHGLQYIVEEDSRTVADHIGIVEVIRQQLSEAEKQLAISRQTLEAINDDDRKCSTQHSVLTGKTEEVYKCREFFIRELDKTRSVMHQLSSKLKEHRCVSCLSQEEVLLFLQELEIPKSIRDSFKKNQIGGKALELVSDHNLHKLGMSDINQRKGLLHAICNVRVHGCIHVAPPPGACGDGLAAWWSSDEVWKWLEEQGFSFPCLKGFTGRTLIHLSEDDITQFGLLLGPALELKAKCEALKRAFFSQRQQDVHTDVSVNHPTSSECVPSDCPPEFLCPISHEIMKDPVVILDG